MTERLLTGRRVAGPKGRSAPVLISADEVEKRITQLSNIQRDLADAIEAIKALEFDAQYKQAEHDRIKTLLVELEEDKKSAEALLSVPEEAFSRLLYRAGQRGQVEGAIAGLVTGIVSSLVVWYLTK